MSSYFSFRCLLVISRQKVANDRFVVYLCCRRSVPQLRTDDKTPRAFKLVVFVFSLSFYNICRFSIMSVAVFLWQKKILQILRKTYSINVLFSLLQDEHSMFISLSSCRFVVFCPDFIKKRRQIRSSPYSKEFFFKSTGAFIDLPQIHERL